MFLVEKGILPREQLVSVEHDLKQIASRAVAGEAASLALVTFQARAAKLGFATEVEATLARSPLVNEARKMTRA